jgi:RNA polymerase sigma factor (sigma-70 family)
MHTTRVSLLLRIKNRRDATAWGEFDALYRPMLQRFAMMRGLNHAEAEDVVQQCMMAVQEHISRFDYDPKKGRFKGWLRTMVNNRVRNLLRDRHEQTAESQDFKRDQAREQPPDEMFDKLWREEHLKHCLLLVRAEVEEATFQAFQKYVIEERPVEEVCKALNLTTNQLYKVKWRVTQKLGEKMKELMADAE